MKDRLKKIRKSVGKTQDEFAGFLGVSKSNLASYEVGRRTPTDAVIGLLCQKCNVNEEWLRYGTGEMFIALDKEDLLMEWAGRILGSESDSFRKRFVKMLMSLTEDEWKWIEEKAKELVNGEVDE